MKSYNRSIQKLKNELFGRWEKWSEKKTSSQIRVLIWSGFLGVWLLVGVQVFMVSTMVIAKGKEEKQMSIEKVKKIDQNKKQELVQNPVKVPVKAENGWKLDSLTSKMVNEEGVPVPKNVVLTIENVGKGDIDHQFLQVLEDKKVKAMWYKAAEVLDTDQGGKIAKELKDKGHMIGSLGFHPYELRAAYRNGDVATVQNDYQQANEMFVKVLGDFPKYYRNATGIRNESIESWMNQSGVKSVVWSLDSGDWNTKNKEAIIQQTIASLHDGGTIQLHVFQHTLELLPQLIDEIQKQGYTITIPSI
ncbi:TPA: polysaccharide deacetylase family protein [Bacillus cereus]|nr:polysaccharide deacetylase family protein [Bacillus cereus]HDR8328459.1 polysaccharide deacetylase family protein [Bacillus cereus]HDR8334222.1 polysaccharide deacetylase family protein [Bacillus cereus]